MKIAGLENMAKEAKRLNGDQRKIKKLKKALELACKHLSVPTVATCPYPGHDSCMGCKYDYNINKDVIDCWKKHFLEESR